MCQYVVMYAESAVRDGMFRELILRQTDEEFLQEEKEGVQKAKLDF